MGNTRKLKITLTENTNGAHFYTVTIYQDPVNRDDNKCKCMALYGDKVTEAIAASYIECGKYEHDLTYAEWVAIQLQFIAKGLTNIVPTWKRIEQDVKTPRKVTIEKTFY